LLGSASVRGAFAIRLSLLGVLVAHGRDWPWPKDAPAAAPARHCLRRRPLQFIPPLLDSLGWVFAALLGLVSICLFAFVVLLMLDLRMSVIIPPGFCRGVLPTP